MRIKKKDILFEQRVKGNLPIPKEVKQLYDLFRKNGFVLYIVGGAVRDTLLSRPIKDYDLATDAPPEAMVKMLDSKGIRNVPVEVGGVQAVVNVHMNDDYEIATFREDSKEGDGRRPDSVTFSTIENDAKRRDLTINSLYYDIATNEIIDLVGGMEDIKNKVIRTVGKATERFDEDRLRILRAIRFAARVDSPLDSDIDKSLMTNSSLTGPNGKKISGQRIMEEVIKGIGSAVHPKQFMNLIDRYGLFDEIFPGVEINKDYLNTHTPEVALAGLFRDGNPNEIAKTLNKLNYAGTFGDNVSFLIKFKNNMNIDNFYDLKLDFDKKNIDGKLLQEFADLLGLDKNMTSKFIAFNTSIDGEDVMRKFNIKQGRGVYLKKKELETDLFTKALKNGR